MKAIMVMFDTLNRRMLPPYGCQWVHAPNFARLAQHTVTFDNCYIGSMPCIPARRELHTGRYNFLHRSWGPLEPFDDSMPQMLSKNGIYTHLVSDHPHYWEDGGATYHTRYNSWEFNRGQDGETWKGWVHDPVIPGGPGERSGRWWRHEWVNRAYMQREEDQPMPQTFRQGIEFIRTNRSDDNWFLQIETFDPHEAFFTQKKYQDLYPHQYDGPFFDWPPYAPVTEPADQVQHVRYMYAALVSMCDAYLGQVLDVMDELNLWQDTMLIVNTDHGFLLGEHGWWGKTIMPNYNEIAQIPLFIWDPRSMIQGCHRQALVQTIDLAPTVLDYFGIGRTKDMQGVPLRATIESDAPVRQAGLFGIYGGQVNVTDGRYVYMRAPLGSQNEPLFEYTLMPAHMLEMFSVAELQDIQLAEPFAFTKGCRTMKVRGQRWMNPCSFGTALYDLRADPAQENPIRDAKVEQRMIQHLMRLMQDTDAPPEQFQRLGLPTPAF